jgi:S1-C subfamily serine protease
MSVGEARRLVLPAFLGLAVIAVLVEGALRRRAPARASIPEAATTPSPVPAMRPDLEKTPLGYESEFFFQLASRARGGLVSLGPAGVTGVLVDPGLALTSMDAADGLAAAGGAGRILGADARLGLAAVSVAASDASAPLAPAARERLHPASYLAAVSLQADEGFRVVPGYLVSARRDSHAGIQLLDVALPLPSSVPLAAVVTLDRELAGVAVRASEGVHVLAVESALSVARALAEGGPCRAVEVATLAEDARRALRLREGVVVEKIWPSAFGGRSGIEAGDILLVWGSSKVGSEEAFRRAYDAAAPGTGVPYTAWRGGRLVPGRVEQPGRDCRPAPVRAQEIRALGVRMTWFESRAGHGLQVTSIPSGSPAAAAALAERDLILAVDGRRLAWPGARRALPHGSPTRPLVLTVRRGDRVKLLVTPSERR